jgi:acetyl esterase/lipase
MTDLHPELTRIRFLPRFSTGPRLTKLTRGIKVKPKDPGPDVTVRTISVPGPEGAPEVTLRVFQPKTLTAGSPALFWIHGGGMVGGSPEQDDPTNIAFAKALGITVAAVKYRLAPEHPAPAAIDDVYAGLIGFYALAAELGFDQTRVAIGGASAGGGLTAALAQVAHDRREVKPVFQLLVYPMLDDRTTLRPASDFKNARVWLPKSNLFGWKSYVGEGVGGPGIPSDYAPGRREDLTGLPPAWIGVGTLDLFHDEDFDYAARLEAAGVPVETFEVPGAFHGFDALFPKTVVVRDWWQRQADALAGAYGIATGSAINTRKD